LFQTAPLECGDAKYYGVHILFQCLAHQAEDSESFTSREVAMHEYLHEQLERATSKEHKDKFRFLMMSVVGMSAHCSSASLKDKRLMIFPRFGKSLHLMIPIINAQKRRFIVRQILQGLGFLHTMKPKAICHRDIKPSNILCNPDTLEYVMYVLSLDICIVVSCRHRCV